MTASSLHSTPNDFETVRPLLNAIAMEFGHDQMCRVNSGFPDIREKGCNCSRAEAAEALAALDRIKERVEALERDVQMWRLEHDETLLTANQRGRRAEAAEARVAELEAALREIIKEFKSDRADDDATQNMAQIARAALEEER